MTDETKIEAMIRAAGKTAPRITPQDLDDALDPMVEPQYYQFPGTTVTVCALTCRNGYVVVGQSSSISLENFDGNIGREVAFKDARSKLWPLLGFLLKDRLAGEVSGI
jgi:hypothetical protein